MTLEEQRMFKAEKIVELYAKRNSQEFVAEEYQMNKDDVQKVTQLYNYSYTIKVTPENKRNGKKMIVVHLPEQFTFLDKYDIENF